MTLFPLRLNVLGRILNRSELLPEERIQMYKDPKERQMYETELRANVSSDRIERFPAARQLLVERKPAKIGSQAFWLLMSLFDRRERVVAKDEILELI